MKRLAILFFLLVPTAALAADKTVYIRTGCANDGDGTASSCAGSPGGAGAHNTCANAISDELVANANLVSMAGDLILDAAGTTAETTGCTIAGFTTSATYLVRLDGDWTGGVWSTSYYRFEIAGSIGAGVTVNDEYVEIQDVQFYASGTGTGNYRSITSEEGNGGLSLKVSNCLMRGEAHSATGTASGIYFRPDVANTRGTFFNNIVYGYSGDDTIGLRLWGSGYNDGEIIIAYNNTVHGANKGISTHGGGASDAQYIKNNIVQSNATAGYDLNFAGAHATDTTATNLSEDTSSPTNTWDSQVVTFVSETGGSEDLHLNASDTAAKDQGTDLSGDAQYAFSIDIDGATRTGTWDIGADEITAAADNLPILQAIGEE